MDNGSFQPRRPPHITVNSGGGSDSMNITSPSTATTPGTARQLLPTGSTGGGMSGQSSAGPAGQGLYEAPGIAESSEMLLPPSRNRGPRPYQDNAADDATSPRSASQMSSRRSSWSSDAGSRDSRSMAMGPFASPFDDSRAPSRAGSDDDNINTQTVAEKFNIMPSAGLLLFPEDVEKDDYLHNPDPSDNDRDECTICHRRGMENLTGMTILALGMITLMVAFPILTFVKRYVESHEVVNECSTDPDCLSDSMALLKNLRTGLIDPDTPTSAHTKTSWDGKTMKLVFSDEFNTDGRTFYKDDDPYLQAVDIWYGVTQDLEWYDPDAASTANGTLNLRFDAFQNHNLNYRSGMIQSWNKLCFKGGRMEASISLPGSGEVEGFWPGFWAMGNLGRPGYPATTDGMWPYSYVDDCDMGITHNQSSTDGISLLPGMKLPACTCKNQEHPNAGVTRTAPEIDAIEASVGFMGPGSYDGANGLVSQSYQIAPFDIWYAPDYDYVAVYDHEITSMNAYRGGPYQEAISATTWLDNDWYDGNAYQVYGFEYTPGDDGNINWIVGENYTWHLDARAIRPNGNVGQRTMPEEPMAIVMNFGMSNSFATVFLPNLVEMMPATMRFDYVRIYQEEGSESVTCDPPGYPTTDYITNHPEPYANPNLTMWADTNYTWPTNSFVDDCTAESS